VVAAHSVVVDDATLRSRRRHHGGQPARHERADADSRDRRLATVRRSDRALAGDGLCRRIRAVELGAETGIKQLLQRPRPAFPDSVATAADAIFPSGHAAGIAVPAVALLLVTCSLRARRAPTGWIVGANGVMLTVATSRVLLGVHYPTDVLGGALLGACVAFAHSPVLPAPER
jgi:membrane-associated phospholipid phosphatase